MGTIKQGILGGFSGKVGAVIGGSWKGTSYMRSVPKLVHNPKTEKQTAQRMKFAVAIQALKPLKDVLRMAWKEDVADKSAFNAAMSYTLKNAVVRQGEVYVIDYGKFGVSRGGLAPAANAAAELTDDTAKFTWADNSALGNAGASDLALMVLVNETTGDVLSGVLSARRSDGVGMVSIPASWSTDDNVRYLAFVSEDGRDASPSVLVI